MPKLFGKVLTKTKILKRVGDISQTADATKFTYSEGRARVRESSRLNFKIPNKK